MAKIVLSKEAPKDLNGPFSLPSTAGVEEFEVPSKGYETDDRALLSEAEVHPWLDVKYDRSEVAVASFRPDTVPASEDVLGAQRSEAFDPEAIKRDRDAVLGDESDGGLAVEAGLDQNKAKKVGDVAVTLAADESNDDKDND